MTAKRRANLSAVSVAAMNRPTTRVAMGDTVSWKGNHSKVHGVMHEGPHLYVLIDLSGWRAWVPSVACDVLADAAPLTTKGA